MFKINKIKVRISEIKYELSKTDYIDNKISAAMAKYLVDEDKSELLSLYEEYKPVLEQRQAWRDEINVLEVELSKIL